MSWRDPTAPIHAHLLIMVYSQTERGKLTRLPPPQLLYEDWLLQKCSVLKFIEENSVLMSLNYPQILFLTC